MSKFRQSRRPIGDKNFKPHTSDVAEILNLSTRIIQLRTLEPVARKTVSQEAWLPASARVCKHLRCFCRKVSILRRLQRLSSVLLDKAKQILTSAAEQGVSQMRLGRSRHSLQAASEAQNLQAERSANVLCRHCRALSFLRGERSSNSSSELNTDFFTQKFSQARSLRDTLAQKEAKEQAEEENIVRDTVEVKMAKIF